MNRYTIGKDFRLFYAGKDNCDARDDKRSWLINFIVLNILPRKTSEF